MIANSRRARVAALSLAGSGAHNMSGSCTHKLRAMPSTKSVRLAALLCCVAPILAWAPAANNVGVMRRPLTSSSAAFRRAALAAPALMSESSVVKEAPFNVTTAVLAAGFAFEAYNEPSEKDARWERGADGCDVAFMSEDFAREVYAGRLEVRLCEAKELSEGQDFTQTLMSGSARDPYVIFAMNEENEEGPKEGAIGLGRAVDRARSSTVWSKSVAEQAKEGLTNLFSGTKSTSEEGRYSWPEDEVISLYVKDPARAQLALTVFDEEVAAADKALGATSVHLADLVRPDADEESARRWSGWVPLTWRPPETQDNVVMGLGAGQIGLIAGAALAGPMGALAGAALGSMITKPVTGQLRLEITYTPLRGPHARPPPALRAREPPAEPVAAAAEGAAEAEKVFQATLATRGLAKGGSEGIDWSTLARRVGLGADESAAFELCCFLTHRGTSSEAAIWRDKSRRLVVIAFRGTSDVMDVLTDVNLLQSPLEIGFNGQKSDDPRRVHSGFFASARAISRRIKELLVSATEGTPGEWSLLITGHSLGGALSQLMATELVGSVDVSRGFKEKEDGSLFGMAARMGKELFTQARQMVTGTQLPKWKEVAMYNFGAPRVGNAEFVNYFNSLFAGREAFRIVNDRDIVPRLPRGKGAAGAVLEYEHVGRTVLVAERSETAGSFDGFWVEGESDQAACPLRDVSPFSNPFSSGTLLADVSGETASFASALGDTWSKVESAAEARSRAELRKAVDEGLSSFEKTRKSIAERLQKMSATDALSMVGLDQRFVESELRLVESLAQGKAIEHHLEPSYFGAMRTALDAAQLAERQQA